MIYVANRVGVHITCFCFRDASGLPPPAMPPLRTYTQTLTMTYACASVAKATLAVTPVLNGKLSGVSARWDDNSLLSVPVHDAMVETGLKGTF